MIITDEAIFYAPNDAARLLGVHPNFIRKQIKSGVLPAVQIGRRFFIPKVVFEKIIECGLPKDPTPLVPLPPRLKVSRVLSAGIYHVRFKRDWIAVTQRHEMGEGCIRIYPSPASRRFRIEGTSFSDISVVSVEDPLFDFGPDASLPGST